MNGWIILLLFGVVVLALLWRPGRLARPQLLLAAAALCVGAAGYAWQGKPGEAGAPVARDTAAHREPDTIFTIERQSLLDHFGETAEWLGTADGLERWGEKQAAASYMRGAVERHPGDVALRLGYAHALLVLADGNVTAPAVKLAYQRAIAVAGANDPSARYFYGLAWLEAGGAEQALAMWQSLWASLPENSPWRAVIAERMQLVRRLAAEQMMMAAMAGAH